MKYYMQNLSKTTESTSSTSTKPAMEVPKKRGRPPKTPELPEIKPKSEMETEEGGTETKIDVVVFASPIPLHLKEVVASSGVSRYHSDDARAHYDMQLVSSGIEFTLKMGVSPAPLKPEYIFIPFSAITCVGYSDVKSGAKQ